MAQDRTQVQPQTAFSDDRSQKIRYAVVGLGWFAQSAVLPAFAHAEKAELVALVSDDPTKLAELSQQYGGVQRTFSYAEYDELLSSRLFVLWIRQLKPDVLCEWMS